MIVEMNLFVCLTIQHYNVPSGWYGKRVFSNLAAELDGIRGQKWNAKRVIVFQKVILQRIGLVTGAKNIHAQTDARLNS